MRKVKRVQICALGGTICSMANDPVEEYYNSASINIKSLIELLPIDKNEIEIQAEQVFQKISQDITNNDVYFLAKRLNEVSAGEETTDWKWLDLNCLDKECLAPNIIPVLKYFGFIA